MLLDWCIIDLFCRIDVHSLLSLIQTHVYIVVAFPSVIPSKEPSICWWLLSLPFHDRTLYTRYLRTHNPHGRILEGITITLPYSHLFHADTIFHVAAEWGVLLSLPSPFVPLFRRMDEYSCLNECFVSLIATAAKHRTPWHCDGEWESFEPHYIQSVTPVRF